MAQKVCETTSYNRFGYHVNGAEYYVVDRTEYKEIIQKYVPTIEGNERRWVDLNDIVHVDTESSIIIEHLKNDASDDDAPILDYYC